ncbi:capsid protein, partial [[Eubacterium] siraeum]|nr:capsid protein [[Eubacterium] siraeum]
SRGKSIFDGGKSDCFDALDEVISQWWDAIRMGRVKQYILDNMIPRNAENGSVGKLNQFGNNYITISQPLQEGVTPKIGVVQPDIKYDAFVSSYTN